MASSLKEFSTTAGSNTTVGSANIAENCAPSGLNNAIREIIAYIIDWFMNSGTIASATTTDLGTKTQNYLSVTGTTTITGLGTPTNKTEYTLTFAGALTLTHNATSLILPGGANITTAAGDVAVMKHEGSGNWRCVSYTKASGQPNAVVTSFAPVAVSDRTEITTIDEANDFVPVWDATDSLIKKAKPSNLVTSTTLVKSTEQAITLGTFVEYTHGLSAAPSDFGAYLVAGATAELGYTTGQRVRADNISINGASTRGASIYADSTKVYMSFGSAAPALLNISTDTIANIDTTKWTVVLWARP